MAEKIHRRCIPFVIIILLTLTACHTSTTVIQKTDDAETHFKQGIMFAGRADYNNAILEFQKSIAITRTAKAYSNLGVCYMKTGKVNKALDALQTAVGMNNCDSFAQYNLAAVYSVMDKTDLGIDALDRALECGFNNYDAIRFDKDLTNLRGEPEFRTTLEKHKIFLQ